ncbi:uncharacterized protein MONOS_18523 [Monocercomonoides exilis]|uniref:uncharacterized protein n=1 Tax=Monocercomonoides exilis TaxID=2049356 RepID=UPI0035596370|nr:hypothetical protein MONOS_18523 [Monocercomonoides exilis]
MGNKVTIPVTKVEQNVDKKENEDILDEANKDFDEQTKDIQADLDALYDNSDADIMCDY